MKQNNIDKNVGPFFGLLLCIIWIAALFFIEGRLYPDQSMTTKPLISWINMGLIPFFVSAGTYLMYYHKLGGLEAARSANGLKSCLLGFVVWLIVILLLFRDSGISYMITGVGGFVTMIAIVLIWDWNTKKNYISQNKKIDQS